MPISLGSYEVESLNTKSSVIKIRRERHKGELQESIVEHTLGVFGKPKIGFFWLKSTER